MKGSINYIIKSLYHAQVLACKQALFNDLCWILNIICKFENCTNTQSDSFDLSIIRTKILHADINLTD